MSDTIHVSVSDTIHVSVSVLLRVDLSNVMIIEFPIVKSHHLYLPVTRKSLHLYLSSLCEKFAILSLRDVRLELRPPGAKPSPTKKLWKLSLNSIFLDVSMITGNGRAYYQFAMVVLINVSNCNGIGCSLKLGCASF